MRATRVKSLPEDFLLGEQIFVHTVAFRRRDHNPLAPSPPQEQCVTWWTLLLQQGAKYVPFTILVFFKLTWNWNRSILSPYHSLLNKCLRLKTEHFI